MLSRTLLLNWFVPVQVLLRGNRLVADGTANEFKFPNASIPKAYVGVAAVTDVNLAVEAVKELLPRFNKELAPV